MVCLRIILFLLISFHVGGTIVVDWKKVKDTSIFLTSFASHIEYVPLETTSECLLDKASFYLTDQYIVAVLPFKVAYLFRRSDGKFMYKIIQKGEGPKEFLFECVFAYGLNDNVLYVNNITSWSGIDIISKEIVETIKKPVFRYEGKYNAIRNPWPHKKKGLYWGYVNNITGNITCKLILFNKEGEVIREFPNYVYYDHKHLDKPFFGGIFYDYHDMTYFKQYQGNDTVFTLYDDHISPHIVFKWDKRQIIYQNQPIWTENQIFMSYINENDRYLYFDCQVNGKLTPKEVFYCLYNKVTGELLSTRHNGTGFIDDIDHLNDFVPIISTSSELMDVISPEEWIDLKKRKRMPLDIDVKFDDNPILRIVHFK